MSSLTHIEKQKIERALRMDGGYVLAFSNRTFEQFFREVVGVEIYESRFGAGSGSKANRMRAFWQIASNQQLRMLLQGLLDGWDLYADGPIPDAAGELFRQILKRLGGSENTAGFNNRQVSAIDEKISQKLVSGLLALSAAQPQKRGYDFEIFLNELFNVYGLSARTPFRLTGEQIDGSFVMHEETYLLEAKWQNLPTAAAELHVFEGKLREKAVWSRGLFISNSGFSEEGLEAFGRGKRIVCMNGLDLAEMLRRKLSFVDVLAAKVRRAAETGSPFASVRELFL